VTAPPFQLALRGLPETLSGLSGTAPGRHRVVLRVEGSPARDVSFALGKPGLPQALFPWEVELAVTFRGVMYDDDGQPYEYVVARPREWPGAEGTGSRPDAAQSPMDLDSGSESDSGLGERGEFRRGVRMTDAPAWGRPALDTSCPRAVPPSRAARGHEPRCPGRVRVRVRVAPPARPGHDPPGAAGRAPCLGPGSPGAAGRTPRHLHQCRVRRRRRVRTPAEEKKAGTEPRHIAAARNAVAPRSRLALTTEQFESRVGVVSRGSCGTWRHAARRRLSRPARRGGGGPLPARHRAGAGRR